MIAARPVALRSSHAGVSLIEVLVAVLVLSFGLLGMAGLLVGSLKLSATSNYRTIAAEQANAMAEVVRANPSRLASFGATTGPTAGVTATCLATGGCTSTQVVSMDVSLWQDRLAAMLPAGTGLICQDSIAASRDIDDSTCDGSGPLVVKICWNEAARIEVAEGTQTCTWTNI